MTIRPSIPQANSLFEQPWWLDIVAPGQWNEAVVKEGDEIIGRLPYVLQGKNIGMPPLTQTLGPWIKPAYREKQPGNSQLSVQKEIIAELLSQLPKHRNFDMCFDCANEYILPYRWLGYKYEPTFSYRISDLSDMDRLYQSFHKTAKKNIKHARHVVFIASRTDPGLMMEQMEKTFSNQGRSYPIPYELIERLIETSSAFDHGRMFVAEDEEGHAHASSFLVYDESSAYDLLGGSDPAYRSSGAKSLLWLEEISFAAGKSKYFDFEGSNIETIENFVRQFGGERVINYRVSRETVFREITDIMKPRVKRLIGYKI